MKQQLIKAHLALFAVNVIYGANYVIAKDVMPEYLPSETFVMTRVVGALILFWLLNRFTGIDKIQTKDFFRLALGGLFGVAVNQLFFFEGLSYTSSVNAAIIMTSTPIIVILLSYVFLKEKINRRKVTGIIIGLSGAIGIILLNAGDKASKLDWSAIGDTFILLNASSYALYLVIIKPLMTKYSPITVISYVFLFGSAFVIPYSMDSFLAQDWNFSIDVYLKITFVVVAVTFIAYLLNIFALKIVTPTVSSSYIYLQPVLSFVFTIIYDQTTGKNMAGNPGIWHLVFTLCIFLGVFLVSRQKSK